MRVMWLTIWGGFHQKDRDLTFPYYEGNVTRNLRDSTKLTENYYQPCHKFNLTEIIGGSTKMIGNQFWPK